jgi:hypothetical protein
VSEAIRCAAQGVNLTTSWLFSLEVPLMSDDSANPSAGVSWGYSESRPTVVRERTVVDPTTGERVKENVYEYQRPAPKFRFEHDAAHGVYRLTSAEGKTEVFRDKPTRYLCVEPDETGAMRPVTKLGRPVYLYLSREEREVG